MKITLLTLMTASFGAIFSQVPDGGIMLNSETGTTYQRIGRCTLTEEAVTGQPFSQALRISVGSDVSNSWDAQVKFPAVAGIGENDVILVAFYARTISSVQETGEGQLTVCIEHNSTYAKELYYNISIGQEWKEYYASVKSATTLAASELNYAFHTGFPSQTIEVGHIRFLNYKNTVAMEDLPVTEITYIGQAPDASWRGPAAERIQQIRKGQADIVVYDSRGEAVRDAAIHIEMVKHQFGFGTAIAASTFSSNETYRNKVFEVFNEVVFENDLKWPQFNPNASNEALRMAFDSLEARQIGVRGHNVIWPSFRFCPPSLELLRDDPVALRNAIDARIDDVTGFTRGRLLDWDVINEPYSEHDLQDILGNEVMADWFKRVRRMDRGVKMYLNDYSIISSGGKNKAHQDYFYDVIRYIDSLGGGIDGIGIQGHFSSELTPIDKVYEILERYATLGKEIKITEHDIDTDQRGPQADYTRDFMTILFSHPSVKSLLTWGFWEGRHWRPDGAFYNTDWTIRPHGQVWLDLIFDQWWTPAMDLTSGDQGELSFEGFLGTYAYTVSAGGSERTGTFTLDHSFQSGTPNQILISLDDALPEAVEIAPSAPGFICQGELVTLQAPEGSGLEYAWYRNDTLLPDLTPAIQAGTSGSYVVKVSKSGLELASAPYVLEVRPGPESSMTLTGDPALCNGESIALSTIREEAWNYEWMNGTVRIADKTTSIEVSGPGSYYLITTSNGCSAASESVEVTSGTTIEVSIEAIGALDFCQGEALLLRTNPVPGKVYTWKNGDTIVEENNFRIHVTSSGAYSVSTHSAGCESVSDTLKVMVHQVPEAAISFSGDPSLCEGNTLTLMANSGEDLSFSWMKGDAFIEGTDPFLEVSEAGSYRVVASNQACSSSSEPVTVTMLSPDDPACATGIATPSLTTRVYPNPFQGSFHVEMAAPSVPGTHYEIFDATGKLILKNEIEPGSSLVDIDLQDRGLLMLRINQSGEYRSFTLISE